MVMKEDILPGLCFPNEELNKAILIAAQSNTLNIRARIVVVVNFLTFVRYIKGGVIVKDTTELYQLMIERRLDMSLAKLGIQTFKTT